MSWRVHVVENTVVINKDIADEIFKATAYNYPGNDGKEYNELYDDPEQVIYENKLSFNSDWAEWSDIIGGYEMIPEILKKHKVFGVIGFADFEGDNEGEIWGYRFDGNGGMEKLVGSIEWKLE